MISIKEFENLEKSMFAIDEAKKGNQMTVNTTGGSVAENTALAHEHLR